MSFTDCKESGCKTQPQALNRKAVELNEHFEISQWEWYGEKSDHRRRLMVSVNAAAVTIRLKIQVRKSPIVPLWLVRSSASDSTGNNLS